MVQVSFFVGISSIHPCTAVDESTLLLSIMAMASHGSQVFHFLRVVCVVKGFEDEFDEVLIFCFSARKRFIYRVPGVGFSQYGVIILAAPGVQLGKLYLRDMTFQSNHILQGRQNVMGHCAYFLTNAGVLLNQLIIRWH
jgi:hypothetical protein